MWETKIVSVILKETPLTGAGHPDLYLPWNPPLKQKDLNGSFCYLSLKESVSVYLGFCLGLFCKFQPCVRFYHFIDYPGFVP